MRSSVNWRSVVVGVAILTAVLANFYVVLAAWQRIFAALQDLDTNRAPLLYEYPSGDVFPTAITVRNPTNASTVDTSQTRISVHVTNVDKIRQVTSQLTTAADSRKRVVKFPQIIDRRNGDRTISSHHYHRHHNYNRDYIDSQNHNHNYNHNHDHNHKNQKFVGYESHRSQSVITTARPKHIKTPVELLRTNLRRQHDASVSVSITQALTTPPIRVTAAQLRRMTLTTAEPPPTVDETTPTSNINDADITIVTALLDIGRERWPHYGRPFGKYQDFMRNVLRVRAPIVVFIDARSTAFVRAERRATGFLHRTVIHEITVEDLPLYRYHHQMQRIIDHEQSGGGWRDAWDVAMRSHPESFNCIYDIVVNSKPYFLKNASVANHFDTEFFVWLDGGYGHGDANYFPADYRWRPTFPNGKITLIKLTPETDPLSRYTLDLLYRQDIAVVSGGFLAGDRRTLATIHELYHWKLIELLTRQKAVDDDQTMLVMLINENADLFNVVHGDWFDAFRLF